MSTKNDDGTDLSQFLTFEIAQEHFGIRVLNVREIIEYRDVTAVPATPPFIRGVINLRGHVVPVVDLAVRFGLAAREVSKRTCIIIAEAAIDGEQVVMGVVADSVRNVVAFGPDDIEPPPSFGTAVRLDYLVGMGKVNDSFVLILHIDRVLSDQQVLAVSAISHSDAAAPPLTETSSVSAQP